MEPTCPRPASLRILLVHPAVDRSADAEVARALEHALGAEVCTASERELPLDLADLDAAIIEPGVDHEVCAQLASLPTVVLGPDGCLEECGGLVSRGVQAGLSRSCAICPKSGVLASTILWAIERAKLVRELEAAQQRERHAALHDALTGLANLRLYRERFRQLLRQGRRTGKRFAVLMLDLDRFKQVNDEFGHDMGDHLLRELARRIKACVRETDTVARRGGDEFAILLDGIRRAKDADVVARKILRCIAKPVTLGGEVVRPTASIGLAVYPDAGTSFRTLEQRADVAMYTAKRAGGNAFVLDTEDEPSRN